MNLVILTERFGDRGIWRGCYNFHNAIRLTSPDKKFWFFRPKNIILDFCVGVVTGMALST